MHATGLMASNFIGSICSDIYYVDAFWSKRKHDLDACVGRRGGSWSLAAEIHPRRKKSQTQDRTEIRFEVFLVSPRVRPAYPRAPCACRHPARCCCG